jgi:hypothetical protein
VVHDLGTGAESGRLVTGAPADDAPADVPGGGELADRAG